jgi:hypothetical protein
MEPESSVPSSLDKVPIPHMETKHIPNSGELIYLIHWWESEKERDTRKKRT